jgi:hypothetical protein
LWSEHEGLQTAQEFFDLFAGFPAQDPMWSVTIGDPGPDALLDFAVYRRGAMTLHALRQEVGDDDFFEILRQWTRSQARGIVTTDEFVSLAEQVSGRQLDAFFDTWLFVPAKPAGIEPAAGYGADTAQFRAPTAGFLRGSRRRGTNASNAGFASARSHRISKRASADAMASRAAWLMAVFSAILADSAIGWVRR